MDGSYFLFMGKVLKIGKDGWKKGQMEGEQWRMDMGKDWRECGGRGCGGGGGGGGPPSPTLMTVNDHAG